MTPTLFPTRPRHPPATLIPDMFDDWHRCVERHPDWTDAKLIEEVLRVREERREAAIKRNPAIFG